MSPLPLMKALVLAACLPGAVCAATPSEEIVQMRAEIDQLRRSHDAQLRALEARLRQAETSLGTVPGTRTDASATDAAPATASSGRTGSAAALAAAPRPGPRAPVTQQTQAAPTVSSPRPATTVARSGANAFNPEIALVLSGQYNRLSRAPTGRIDGYALAADAEGLRRGFALGESELRLAANIDPRFYGSLTLALDGDDGASIEEAYVQTTALAGGRTLKAGRFYSGIGYLNAQHAHTWDFIDNPLAYQAFLGTQFAQDGVQARWLLPTERYVELLAEVGNGARFPGAGGERHGAGALALGLHTGGDWSVSSNWQAGVSVLRTAPRGRESLATDRAGSEVRNAFDGRSTLWIVDGVWKWAPQGDATRTNFKLQGEYFRRREAGELTHDTAGAASAGSYRAAQSGAYVQGLYQFVPGWRTGLRHDRLAAGSIDFGSNAAALAVGGFQPRRSSVLLEWAPSEFSRVRLQLANDRSRAGAADRQLLLQYQMSLGAHGAHGY